jgi:hypothetical protein
MSTAGARAAAGGTAQTTHGRGRTLSQWFCVIVGPALIALGLLGFFADSHFDVDSTHLQGDGIFGFEVNGTHNVVHLASGLFLLALAKRRRTARFATITFGVVWGLVGLLGVADGNDVLGLIPVNPADNILHLALAAAALVAGFSSPADDLDAERYSVRSHRTPFERGHATANRAVVAGDEAVGR